MRWIVQGPADWQPGWTEETYREWQKDALRPALRAEKAYRWAEELACLPEYGASLLRLPQLHPEAAGRLASLVRLSPDRPIRSIPLPPGGEGEPPAPDPTAPPVVVPRPERRGRGVTVAVLDETDVEDGATHPEVVTRFVAEDTGTERQRGNVLPGIERHATHVAYVLAGDGDTPASDASIVGYRTRWAWQMVQAIDHIRRTRSAQLVCTATQAVDDGAHLPANELDLLTEAIASLRRDGIAFVAAAGNDRASPIACPGAAPSAITVGALGSGLVLSGKVTRDQPRKPTLLGPWTSFPGAHGQPFSGTSATTPRIAAYIAVWLEKNPRMTPDDIEDALRKSCRTDPEIAQEEQGFGVFDPALAEGVELRSRESIRVVPRSAAPRSLKATRPRLLSTLLEH